MVLINESIYELLRAPTFSHKDNGIRNSLIKKQICELCFCVVFVTVLFFAFCWFGVLPQAHLRIFINYQQLQYLIGPYIQGVTQAKARDRIKESGQLKFG